MPFTSIARVLVGAALALSLTAANAAVSVRTIQSSGIARLQALPMAGGGLQSPELSPAFAGREEDEGVAAHGGKSDEARDKKALRAATKRVVNRSIATARGLGVGIAPVGVQQGDALKTWDGLRFFDQRFANGGNQFSVEPPDQALCVSEQFVVESVNDVIRFYDKSGVPVSGVIDLNTFYSYPAAIQRTNPPVFGPFITDPTCYYDPDVHKFFHVVLTLDVNEKTGAFTGDNHLDLAVSNDSDPRNGWTIYRIPVQNTGLPADTPNHPNCPCIGDYPHIGADKYGIYLTTNEFPFAGGFNAAQIYALSKKQLAASAANVNLVLFDTSEFRFQGNPGFTVWPAVSPSQDYETRFGGVEYLMSSVAVFSPSGNGNRIRVFALMNTSAIDSDPSQISLVDTAVHVSLYGVPPPAAQKRGPAPLGECLNDRSINLGGGFIGCWQLFVDPPAPTELVPELVDTNDSRMQQVFFTGGRLYGALDTPVNMPGGRQAGIAYYVIRPYPQAGSLAAVLENEGKFGVAGNSVSYPAIAALPDGRGIISFTLVGPDYYPSAAYIRFNASGLNGNVRVAGAGLGPEDGFSGYVSLGDSTVARWGDYGAAALSQGTFWIASEYIGQVCTLQEFLATNFTCGDTRGAFGNWYTRISAVAP
ncbi:hypothetical protein [Piscinibacter sp. XHJ-5]|uniref:hypothetical protein n=1 Tax=Piscinibacter sp. XHJ-5 TaxID=3037797 RepID=UPI00245340B1|nr:hypothetical protein [Piscinibacter sp. XHJ-5]